MSNFYKIESDQYAINVAKGLVMDMVRNVDSGHTGGAFSSLDYTYILFKDFLKFDPDNPKWEEIAQSGRDFAMNELSNDKAVEIIIESIKKLIK